METLSFFVTLQLVVYSMEAFWPLGHILVWWYWNILPPGVLKHFEPKIYKDFELYQVFMLNWFKYFEVFWPKKSDKKIHTQCYVPKCFNTSILYTIDAHFYNPSVKIGFASFFSSSDTQKFHHLLGSHTIGINSSFNSFLSALCFSNLICLTKKLSWIQHNVLAIEIDWILIHDIFF